MSLEDRIRARIQMLESKRESLDAAIAELSALLALEGLLAEAPEPAAVPVPAPRPAWTGPAVPVGNDPAPGVVSATPPAEEKAPRGRPGSVALRIAQFLAEHGPTRTADIQASLGLSLSSYYSAVSRQQAWFHKDPKDVRSPLELTEEGRAALARSFPGGAETGGE